MLSILYAGLIVFIIIFELTRYKDSKFDFLSLFHLFFILLYPLPGYFIANITADHNLIINTEILKLNNHNLQYNWQVPLSIYLTYCLVILGYYAPSAQKFGNIVTITSRSERTFWYISVGILCLGWISIYIYGSQYGGIVETISQANIIRSQAVEVQAFAFFVRLVYFIYFAAYLLASSLFIKKNQQGKIQLWLLFILAIAGCLIASLMVSARATMILAIINFYLAYLLYKRKFAIVIVIPLLIVIILFIVYGKILFYSLSGLSQGGYVEVINRFQEAVASKNEGNFLMNLIAVFSYGFISLYAACDRHYSMRLFSDWFYGFSSFIPERLIEVEIPLNVSAINSTYLLGHHEYTIPAGFIAACIYSWSWIGVIIFSFFYGWLGRYLHTILQRHLYKICWIPFIYVTIAQAWCDFLASGDPKIFLQTNFWVLGSLFFLLIFGVKISLKNSTQKAILE